jgi:transcription elongation GreA/GreB family factor
MSSGGSGERGKGASVVGLSLFDESMRHALISVYQRPEMGRKVSLDSTVTVRNPDGKILKVKFSKSQAIQNIKPDSNGLITVYEKSPLAITIIGRTEGETCQLGMLELYYEILNVE